MMIAGRSLRVTAGSVFLSPDFCPLPAPVQCRRAQAMWGTARPNIEKATRKLCNRSMATGAANPMQLPPAGLQNVSSRAGG
jgi:hypothetical protein